MWFVCVALTQTHATVERRHSWLARLFGAKTETYNVRQSGTHGSIRWVHAATGRPVSEAILDALDGGPITTLPKATAYEAGL